MTKFKFEPDKFHCPQICLCSICENNKKCENACNEYKQMAIGCGVGILECGMCKVKRCE